MFHKAVDLQFEEGTILKVFFEDGIAKTYDMAQLFPAYPQLEVLRERSLFTSGKLMGFYGIAWNDQLDIEAETIYQEGMTAQYEGSEGASIDRQRIQIDGND